MADPAPPAAPARRGVLGLVVGVAALSSVVGVAVAWGDREGFAAVLRESHPAWLLVGAALQAATYLMPAGGWAAVLRRAGQPAPLRDLYALALVQLFTNQAVPVGGLAGLVVVLSGMDRRGVPRPIGLAAMVVDQLGYVASYNLGIVLAVAWYAWRGLLPPAVVGVATVAVAVGLASGGALLWLTTPGRALPAFVSRRPQLAEVARALIEADQGLVRALDLVGVATVLRCGNLALDAATSWACLRAVGVELSVPDAAAAFVLASLGRTLGLVPGGLGTYEGTSIAALVAVGVPIEAALTATLATRLLTYWLPMVPGLVLGGRLAGR